MRRRRTTRRKWWVGVRTRISRRGFNVGLKAHRNEKGREREAPAAPDAIVAFVCERSEDEGGAVIGWIACRVWKAARGIYIATLGKDAIRFWRDPAYMTKEQERFMRNLGEGEVRAAGGLYRRDRGRWKWRKCGYESERGGWGWEGECRWSIRHGLTGAGERTRDAVLCRSIDVKVFPHLGRLVGDGSEINRTKSLPYARVHSSSFNRNIPHP